MRNYIKPSLSFFLLLLVTSVGLVNAQSKAGPEKAFVERIYKKFALYQKAQKKYDLENALPLQEHEILKFTIRHIRSGPISEINNKKVMDVVTPPTGRIIKASAMETNKTHNEPDGRKSKKQEFGLHVEWTNGRYASIADLQITVGRALTQYADRYPNINRYISYEVTVMFENQTRTYKALVFLQKKLGSPQKTFFSDNVSSFNGILNEIAELKKLPVGSQKELSRNLKDRSVKFLKTSTKSVNSAAFNKKNFDICTTLSGEPGPAISSSNSDDSGHFSGKTHWIYTVFRPSCSRTASCQQTCRVIRTTSSGHGDDGGLIFPVFYHNVVQKGQNNDSTGGVGTISCSAINGIAVQSCTVFGCSGEIGISGSGVSAKVSGGNVWNWTHSLDNSCTATPINGGGDGPGVPPVEDELCTEMEQMCFAQGGTWKGCNRGCFSPIVIDIDGDGFDLTDGQNGVDFDLIGDGTKDRISWTSANSDDAWLVLDRNNNGKIDNGLELFGNYTPQPSSIPVQDRNGFQALAIWDKSENGGNGDGIIDERDTVFSDLRLWQDKNHNGTSESNELHTLKALGIKALETDFKESRKTDGHGNRFKYRGKVRSIKKQKTGRWAWDVFPVRPQPWN